MSLAMVYQQKHISEYFSIVNKIKPIKSNQQSDIKANIKEHFSDYKQKQVQGKTKCVRNKRSRMTDSGDSNSTVSNLEGKPERRHLAKSMIISSDEDDFEDTNIRTATRLWKSSPRKNKALSPGHKSKTTCKQNIDKKRNTSETSSQKLFVSTNLLPGENKSPKINILSNVVLQPTHSKSTVNMNATPYENIVFSTNENGKSTRPDESNDTIYNQLTQIRPFTTLDTQEVYCVENNFTSGPSTSNSASNKTKHSKLTENNTHITTAENVNASQNCLNDSTSNSSKRNKPMQTAQNNINIQSTPGSESSTESNNTQNNTNSTSQIQNENTSNNNTTLQSTASTKKTINVDVSCSENSPPKIIISGNLNTETDIEYNITIHTPRSIRKAKKSSEVAAKSTKKVKLVTIQAQSSPTTSEDDEIPLTEQAVKNVCATLLNKSIEKNINDSATNSIANQGKTEPTPTTSQSLKRPKASVGKSPKKTMQNHSSQMTLTQCMGKKKSKLDSDSLKEEAFTSPINRKAVMDGHNLRCENVQQIISWVFGRQYFRILFTKREEDLLDKLYKLPNVQHRIVCLRLLTRQDKWHNLNNLCADLNLDQEQIQLQEMLNVLKADFVESDYSKEDVITLLNYISAQDVKDICASFKLKLRTNNKKANNIALLYTHSLHQKTLTTLKTTEQILRDRVNKKMGICVKLKTDFRDLLFRIHLLYSFANSNITTFNDIYFLMNRIKTGELVKSKNKIDSTMVFDNRIQFERYYKAWNLRREFDDELEKNNIDNQYLLCKQAFTELKELLQDQELVSSDKYKPLFLRRFSAPWTYCTVISSGSRNLGKHHPKDMCEWLEILLKQPYYCNHKRGLWYTQLSMIKQAHLKDIPGAAETIMAGISDVLVTEVGKHELSIRGSKINNKKISQMLYDELQCVLLPPCDLPEFRTIQAQMVHNNQMGRKLRFVNNTAEGKEYRSVEDTAIKYYTTHENFTDGMHCEGRLLIKLFHIFFWDIIFAEYVSNTFLTEIQHFPLDLSSGEFYVNRKQKIDARLEEIRELWSLDIICQFLSNTLQKYAKEIASLTNILNANSKDVTSLQTSDFGNDCSYHLYVRCIEKKVLAAIFERLVKNYKLFHSGLPDLFLWNKKELKCCFVEVKSENDKLSTTQILWLHYLRAVGANAEVCRVESIGSSSKKSKKKTDD